MGRFDFFQPNVEEMMKKRDVDALIKALTAGNDWDGTWSIRPDAAKALGKIGDARAVEPLTQALKNVYPDVRQEAAKALEKIQAKKSLQDQHRTSE